MELRLPGPRGTPNLRPPPPAPLRPRLTPSAATAGHVPASGGGASPNGKQVRDSDNTFGRAPPPRPALDRGLPWTMRMHVFPIAAIYRRA